MKEANRLSQADRRGVTAFSVFAALCLAGILTLFSQADLQNRRAQGQDRSAWTSLNPGEATTDGVDNLLPATIERGASFPVAPGDGEAEKKSEQKPARQVLRLR